ncbi:MAG TPA: rRNA maturation RNase YbeY [Acidimicrobiales bacterium]|nr:rRNA maturation RNase YbeY [Acidimicrobiales bacterium]
MVDVFAADEQSEEAVDVARWADLARHVLHAQGARDEVEVTLLFVDEPTIAELHERFLGEPGPTDVLAFPVEEEPERGGRYPDEGGTGPGGALPSEEDEIPVLLGDVVICPAVAARNAAERGGNLEDETALLVVHGLLHLLGMDHDEDVEAEQMERRERELLARFHVGGP